MEIQKCKNSRPLIRPLSLNVISKIALKDYDVFLYVFFPLLGFIARKIKKNRLNRIGDFGIYNQWYLMNLGKTDVLYKIK